MVNNLLLNKKFNSSAVSSSGEKPLKNVLIGNTEDATLYMNNNGFLYTKDLYFIPTVISEYAKAGNPKIFIYKRWRYEASQIEQLKKAYNDTLEPLTQLRNSGISNIIELREFNEKNIEFIRKVGGHFELQAINADGLTTLDNDVKFEYQVKKEKKTLKAL